ncbi:MAG: hypothetical protein JJT95_06110 [Pararhodobacter sp.]|nr:hypothetical protein [Pararhodobacter sp.]
MTARHWADIERLEPTEPERKLIAACKAGEPCVLGDGKRPEGPDPKRTIRAELLRYLILGGCDSCRVHEHGVRLAGAYVTGALDLSFATARGETGLFRCRFEYPVNAQQTRFDLFLLDGSALPGLLAMGMQATGSVFLRDGFEAEGEVYLTHATIGGQLACDGGSFKAAKGEQGRRTGPALNAEGARVKGGVFLNDGFNSEGEVSLSSATIGGQLACDGGNFKAAKDERGNLIGLALSAHSARVTGSVFLRDGFATEGAVNLSGARIDGQLDCTGGKFKAAKEDANRLSGLALNAQSARVSEGLLWRGVVVEAGVVNLSSARVGDLVDDMESWPQGGRLVLDGFTYERISGAFTDSRQRLDWLARGTVWKGEFHPQPYAQLAKVLREMGHERAARDVLVEQGRLIRFHIRRRALAQVPQGRLAPLRRAGVYLANSVRWVWDIVQRIVIGYGYKPFRSLMALAVLLFLAVSLAQMAWRSGAMVPNSDVVLTSPGWQALAHSPHPARYWTAPGALGQDWESFNRYAWGFDVVVPILHLGQSDAWAPSTARGWWGVTAWWGRWVLSIAGWIVVALAAAAVTGIIQRKPTA